MPSQNLPARVLGSTPFVVLTALVGTVLPLAAFVLSTDVRGWIEQNGLAVFWVGVGAVVVLLIALDLQRRTIAPDARDQQLIAALKNDFVFGQGLIDWLRDDFDVARFAAVRWRALEDLSRQWNHDASRRFSDRRVDEALRTFLEELKGFISRTTTDVWYRHREGDPDHIGLPREWPDADKFLRDRWHTAVEETQEKRARTLRAFDALLVAAHKRGL